MLQKQVISRAQLRKEGFSKKQVDTMFASLKLFPTPFKNIYYVPSEEEKKGWFIDKPMRVLTGAVRMFLESPDFYYSCTTAEERLGIRWTPSNEIHIVNGNKSGRIDLEERIERDLKRRTYRAGRVAHVLSIYGRRLIFHRTKNVASAKIKRTPYGNFALKSQILVDKKRLREKV